MVNFWLIAGKVENLELLPSTRCWAFSKPDPEQSEKFYRFWAMMREGDHVLLQAIKWENGWRFIGVIGFAKVLSRYYDDKVLIWPDELKENKCMYPYKVEFSTIVMLSPKLWERLGPKHRIILPEERYVKGIGLGILEPKEFYEMVDRIKETWNVIIIL